MVNRARAEETAMGDDDIEIMEEEGEEPPEPIDVAQPEANALEPARDEVEEEEEEQEEEETAKPKRKKYGRWRYAALAALLGGVGFAGGSQRNFVGKASGFVFGGPVSGARDAAVKKVDDTVLDIKATPGRIADAAVKKVDDTVDEISVRVEVEWAQMERAMAERAEAKKAEAERAMAERAEEEKAEAKRAEEERAQAQSARTSRRIVVENVHALLGVSFPVAEPPSLSLPTQPWPSPPPFDDLRLLGEMQAGSRRRASRVRDVVAFGAAAPGALAIESFSAENSSSSVASSGVGSVRVLVFLILTLGYLFCILGLENRSRSEIRSLRSEIMSLQSATTSLLSENSSLQTKTSSLRSEIRSQSEKMSLRLEISRLRYQMKTISNARKEFTKRLSERKRRFNERVRIPFPILPLPPIRRRRSWSTS